MERWVGAGSSHSVLLPTPLPCLPACPFCLQGRVITAEFSAFYLVCGCGWGCFWAGGV